MSTPYQLYKRHDTLFKATLENKPAAIAFVKQFLSPAVLDIIDLNSLHYPKGTFILNDLKERYSDVLLRFKYKDQESGLTLAILIDHKSEPDDAIALTLLGYLHGAYQKAFSNQARDKKAGKINAIYLDAIIPVVYYHNPIRWEPPSFQDLFGKVPSFIKAYIPFFRLEFIDLHPHEDEKILSIDNHFLMASLLAQKYVFSADELIPHLTRIANSIIFDEDRILSTAILYYTIKAYNKKDEIMDKFLAQIRTQNPNEEMDIFDRIEAEAMEKKRDRKKG